LVFLREAALADCLFIKDALFWVSFFET